MKDRNHVLKYVLWCDQLLAKGITFRYIAARELPDDTYEELRAMRRCVERAR